MPSSLKRSPDTDQMSTSIAGFPFAQLPSDLCKLVIDEWVDRRAVTISDLDIAFCNHELLPQFLQWIDGMAVTNPQPTLIANINSLGRSARVSFIKWLDRRHISLSSITIKPEDLRKDDFLLYVANMNPQVLSKVTDLTIHATDCTETEVSACGTVLGQLKSVRSINVTLYEDHSFNDLPWQYLPVVERVQLIGHAEMDSDVQVSILQLQSKVPTITSLKLRLTNLDLFDVAVVCALLPLLKELYMYSTISITRPIPSDETLSACPAFPRLEKLSISCILENQTQGYDVLVLHLVGRCPNLKELTINAADLSIPTAQSIIKDVLPNLHQLYWFDKRIGFSIYVTVAADEAFGEFIDRAKEVTETLLSVSEAHDFVPYFAHLFASVPTTWKFGRISNDFTEGILEHPGAELFTHLISSMTNLTVLKLASLQLPSEPGIWTAILSCPQLKYLKLDRCTNIYPSFTLGLAVCATNQIVSKVTKLVFDNPDDLSSHSLLCSVFPIVFPALIKLVCLIKSTEAGPLTELLLHLPNLHRLAVYGKSASSNDWFLPAMQQEFWKLLATRSKCHNWRIILPDLSIDWSHLKRMIDCLGNHLNDLNIQVPAKLINDTDNGEGNIVWWNQLKVVNPTPEWRDYLRQRRFRISMYKQHRC